MKKNIVPLEPSFAAPPARIVAILLVVARQRFDEENGRRTTRYRISNKTVRRIANRPRLSAAFVDEIFVELGRLGYYAFSFEDYVAIIDSLAVRGWVRISAKRLEPELDAVFAELEENLGKVISKALHDRTAEQLSGRKRRDIDD